MTFITEDSVLTRALLIQSVECQSYELEVVGSSPTQSNLGTQLTCPYILVLFVYSSMYKVVPRVCILGI